LKPGTTKGLSDFLQIIDGHVPLAGFNTLQRTPVDGGLFRQGFLGHTALIAETMDVAPDNNMRFQLGHPEKLSVESRIEGGSICRFYLGAGIASC
jgi:CheY-like chemotaxis protein